MEKGIAFKLNNNLVTIHFNTKDYYLKDYFALSADIYELKVYSSDELAEKAREEIEENLDYYIDQLQNNSINELVDDRVEDILYYNVGYNGIYSEPKGDNLIQVEFLSGGQSYDELLELLPDSKPIKELISLWKKYQLEYDVNHLVINQVIELLNQLDSGKSKDDLAEAIVTDYIKENY